MASSAPPPTVRLRLSCADGAEYRRSFAARFATAGVFIPTARVRPIGSLVTLKIELLDGSIAAAMDARVESQVEGEGKRPGYFVRFVAAAGRGGPAEAPGGGARLDGGRRGNGSAPAHDPGQLARLEEYLFSDTPAPLPPRPGEPPALGRQRGEPASFLADDPAHFEQDWSDLAAPEPEAPPAAGAQPEPARCPAAGEPIEPPPAIPPQGQAPASPRHLRLVGWLVVAAVLGLVLSVTFLLVNQARADAAQAEASFAASIRAADACLGSGRLAGPGPDTALQHLTAARRLAPEDPRLTSRAALVAEKLEELGRRALARADREEARVHLETALAAEPGRRTAFEALQQISAVPAGHPAGGSRP